MYNNSFLYQNDGLYFKIITIMTTNNNVIFWLFRLDDDMHIKVSQYIKLLKNLTLLFILRYLFFKHPSKLY